MQPRLERARPTVYAPDRGALDPAACSANDAAGGFWVPWLTPAEAGAVFENVV